MKKYYSKTNKKDAEAQIAILERRNYFFTINQQKLNQDDVSGKIDDPYVISHAQNSYIHLPTWLKQNKDDPAIKVCYI